jgi:two-component system phosphate regulon sensor histidine kinase PhoR
MFSGVILVDQHGHILLSNRASQQILNKTQADLIGRSYSEVTKNLDLRQWIEEVFRYKKGLRNELHLYYPEEKIVDTSLAPLFDEYNAFVGVVIVLHDITEIRRLEKIRSDFVANASHELKTPVTSIRGFTETLLDGAMYEEELLHSFLQIINKESERLQRLIDDILDLSKIEQKKLSLEVKPCHMESIINDVILHVQTDLEKKGIQFSSSIPGDLVIEADPDRLKQIFINLIVNAIQYTPENGKVWIETEVKEDKVIFAVCDTGVGIPKQDLRRVFERFYRVDKARSRHSGGTGLGLAIVKHLVESHHGRIWVESVEGKGSKFFVELTKENKKFS